MYISQIGKVLRSEIHEDFFKEYFNDNLEFVYKYVKKGATFKNLLANSNYLILDKDTFFNNFELWENENGIGTIGKEKRVELLGINEIEIITISSKEPIFVGDILTGGISGQVVYAEGRFNALTGYWFISCKMGFLTPITSFGINTLNENNNKVLEALNQVKTSIDKLASELDKLKGKAKSEISGTVSISPPAYADASTSIIWDTAITTLVSEVNNISSNLDTKIKEVEDYLI